MTTGKPIRNLLAVAVVAVFAPAIGQIQAEPINVPGGEFGIYKPGTDYTITAAFPAGNVWATGVGTNLPVKGGTADYSDGTSGTSVDCPGWVLIHGTCDLLNNGVNDSVGFNAFAAWGGDTRIQSADSLGPIAGNATYTLSAMVDGAVATGPVAFYLLAGEVALTPSSSVGPVPPVSTWQAISRTFNAADIAQYVGQPMKITVGVEDENDIDDRMIFDNITLEVENLTLSGTVILVR